MNTDKVNQHYVPKFYLRLFSINQNGRQLGLWNLNNHVYIADAKLKTQASKKFFYGVDGKIEDALMNIESTVAPAIHKIVRMQELPARNEDDYYRLVLFVALTIQRNPIMINYPMQSRDKMKELLKDKFGSGDNFDTVIPDLTKDEAIRLLLSNLDLVVKLCLSLNCKLLINDSIHPFITSDFPVVRYNQFLEQRKWIGSDTGFGNRGLQIFLPLNSKLMIILYDVSIYKVGNRKNMRVQISSSESIDQLNILQMLNCDSNIYFNEEAKGDYIQRLYMRSRKYKRGNGAKVELGGLINKHGKLEKDSILHLGMENIRAGLKVESIKFTSRGKRTTLNNTMAQIRPGIANLLE